MEKEEEEEKLQSKPNTVVGLAASLLQLLSAAYFMHKCGLVMQGSLLTKHTENMAQIMARLLG